MKNKLDYLVEHSLNKKIKTKWFKIVNVILAILIVAICNIDRIINAFGGDFTEIQKIIVVDNSGSYNLFKLTFEESAKLFEDIGKYEIEKSNENIVTLTEKLNEEDDTIVVNIMSDYNEILKAEVYSYDYLSTIESQLLQTSLTSVKSMYVLQNSSLTQEEINALSTGIKVDMITTNPDLNEEAEAKDLVASGIITIFIVPIFILIVLLVQMIGAEINDEKTTRGMEIIISSVPVKSHFISKIYASLKYILIQGGLLLGYIGIGLLIRLVLNRVTGTVVLSEGITSGLNDIVSMFRNSGVVGSFLIALPIIVVLILVTFLIYSILASVLASMTTSIEDYQQLQTPLMLVMVVGYYMALMAAVFEGSLFIKIMAFIPMISFLVAPSIYLLGQMSIFGLLISTALSAVFLVFIYKIGLKIYKVGILNYSSTDLWKKMFKSLKTK